MKPKPSSSSEAQIEQVAKFINGLSPHNLHRGVEAISELVSAERALGGIEAVEYILAMPHDGDDWYGDDLREYLNQLKKG